MRTAAAKSSDSSWKNTPELLRRQTIIAREYVKFHVALSIEPNETDFEGKVALALNDWGSIPTHWLRRACARARLAVDYMPKPAQVLRGYKDARDARRRRAAVAKKLREARRLCLESGPMNEDARANLMRALYRNIGSDYDRVKKQEAFEAEVKNKRAMRRRRGGG